MLQNIAIQELNLFSNIVIRQVIGVPDSRLGEEVCACIRLVDGSRLTVDQVKQYCKGKVFIITIPFLTLSLAGIVINDQPLLCRFLHFIQTNHNSV